MWLSAAKPRVRHGNRQGLFDDRISRPPQVMRDRCTTTLAPRSRNAQGASSQGETSVVTREGTSFLLPMSARTSGSMAREHTRPVWKVIPFLFVQAEVLRRGGTLGAPA